MNVGSYDLDQLRKLIRKLEKENDDLKNILRQNKIPFPELKNSNLDDERGEEESDLDQGGRIIEKKIDNDLARYFYSMFWGRTDVYAKRSRNGNYYPVCEGYWNDGCPLRKGEARSCSTDCFYRKYKKLEPWIIAKHLLGEKEDETDVIGIYPLLMDGTCRFIVFDFDDHEKNSDRSDAESMVKYEVNALRKICEDNEVPCLVERSRSGKGAHVWIFFDKPINAKLARNFGFLLLDKGMTEVNLRSFRYYDRLFPVQDNSSGIGNLIALPLQGKALKNGNSAFVDENWNAYPDQWKALFQTKKLSKADILDKMVKWQNQLAMEKGLLTDFDLNERPKPWRRNERFSKEDVVGMLHIVFSDGLYIDALNLMPRIQNQIRSLAAFDNPIFYKNKALGYSNYYNYSTVYLGKDIDGYIRLPRGLKEKLFEKLEEAGIVYELEDKRQTGRPIRVEFKGDLRSRQDLAADAMFLSENGILNAATGFGKTVIASYLIGKRKLNTLIILQNSQLIDQWINELSSFLDIKEKPVEYKTKGGKIRKRDSVIGMLRANKDTLSGIIDIAMVGSLYKKGDFHERINDYGMVIIDECQHSASNTFVEVLKRIDAKYVYGLSANLKRSDDLDKIALMMIGPIRHRYTALQRAKDNKMVHLIVPRFTRTVDFEANNRDINRLYNLICFHTDRNEQIVHDIRQCLKDGKTPLILTKYKEHARILEKELKEDADHVFLIYGDNSDKENKQIIGSLKQIDENESVLLIATGQMIGEGFDFPRLDTLIMASPVSHESCLEQYVGRIDRVYKGKKEVFVYDYIDSHIPVFANMYKKRLKTYKKIGFSVYQGMMQNRQIVNAIYDYGSYSEVFERDLIEAERSILISSPSISLDKIDRLIDLIRERQEAGVKISVITSKADDDIDLKMIADMKKAGFNVVAKENAEECFAIMDDELVWYGGADLLGKEDVRDNLIRIKDANIAAELSEKIAYEIAK